MVGGVKDLPGETLAALKSALSAILGVAKDVGACGASVVDAVGDTILWAIPFSDLGEDPHLPDNCGFDNTTAIVDGMLEALSGVKDAIGEAVSSGDATAVVIALGGLFAGLDTKACEKHSILYCLGKAAPKALAAAGTTWAAGKLLKKFKTGLKDAKIQGGAIPDAVPTNLTEQLALQEARASGGKQIMEDLADEPRLAAVYGEGEWVKMQSVLRGTDANTTIHWFKNLTTGLEVEFKFK